MTVTKGDIVNSAFKKIRIWGLTSKPQPNQVQDALEILDDMVLGWENMGICLGYNRPSEYQYSDPADDSGVNDTQALALKMNLAVQLSSYFGKNINQVIQDQANSLFNSLFSVDLIARENNKMLPTGSGNYYSYYSNYATLDNFNSELYGNGAFFYNKDNAPDNCVTNNILVGETNFFYIDFFVSPKYLNEDETIDSYTVEDGELVTVDEYSESDGTVTLKCTANSKGWGIVKITLTTSEGRIYPYKVNFNITDQ